MEQLALKTISALRSINRVIALLVGAGLFLCAAFILAEIITRRIGGGLGGTDEISGYVMAIASSWGMAYCLLELGHVRIDLIRGRLNQFSRALVDLLCLATLAAVASLIAYRCWPVVERSLDNSSRANTPLETPLALVQMPWFLGWSWFALSSWLVLLATAALLWHRRYGQIETIAGVQAEADVAAESAESAAQ